MLKPVVEHVDSAAEMGLGDLPGERPVGRHEHRHTGQAARQHQRFVPGTIQIGVHPFGIPNHHDTVADHGPAITAAEHRRPLAKLQQQLRHVRHDGRLAAAAEREIPYADDRSSQMPATLGAACKPLSSGARQPVMRGHRSCGTRSGVNGPA